MPKQKVKQESTSDSDSGPEDRGPAKKFKPEPKKENKEKSSKSSSPPKEEEENSWSLGQNRFVRLREFKNKWYVDVREHYNADGELRPGKKGLMLTMEQWQKFKACISDVDEAIKKNV